MVRFKSERYASNLLGRTAVEKLAQDVECKAQQGWALHSWKALGEVGTIILALFFKEEEPKRKERL